MKRYIGVIVVVVVICAAIFWCGRIYSINHGYIDNTQVVEAGEAIECDGLVIRCVEAHIYSIDDYKTRFGVDNVETLSSEDRFVCACLNIENNTNESISWDAVMDMTSCGFESATWCSSVNPYDMQDINVFSDNELKSGADQNIWYVTKAARVSFGDKTWGHMDEETFYYVPVLEPAKIRMKLDME
ncbi:MAG: hypothetical protein ACLSTR_00040 [Coprococcus sp.]